MANRGDLTFAQACCYVAGAVEKLEIASSTWEPFDPSVPVAPNVVVNWQFRLKPQPPAPIVRQLAAENHGRERPSRDRNELADGNFAELVLRRFLSDLRDDFIEGRIESGEHWANGDIEAGLRKLEVRYFGPPLDGTKEGG